LTGFDQPAAERNVRGEFSSISADLQMWKYSASTYGNNPRADSDRDANYIIYRLTEIYLMKAEALIMLNGGTQENYEKAAAIINLIRERGGLDVHPETFTSEQVGLEYLLKERQREFLSEGKRWFDLVRIAMKRESAYKEILIDLLVVNVPASDRDLMRSKLEDPYGWFFPINQDEIETSGGVIVQNPYYASL
jgi:hypothetical protein